MCQANNIHVLGLAAHRHMPATHYQGKGSSWQPADVPMPTWMCTACTQTRTERSGTAAHRDVPDPSQPGARSLPSTCRKVNTDKNKTIKITSPESTQNGSKNSVTFCLLLLRLLSPCWSSLATELAAPLATWPLSLVTLTRTLWSLSPSLTSHKKHRTFCVAGAAETQVGTDTQTKSKGKIQPRQHTTFSLLFLQPWEKSIRCSESNSA